MRGWLGFRVAMAGSLVVATLSSVGVAASVPAGAALAEGTPDASTPSATAAAAGGLTAAGRWIVDQQGRVMTMHGFDIVKKVTPFYPANFTGQDAQFLASEGVTAARIGFIWAGVEPAPGAYDDHYIDQIVKLAELLESYGIHPLIDFHQDGYGTTDPACAATGVCNIASGDGAPGWAQLGSSADADFEAFWDNKPASDGVGIQTHFIDAWKHAAQILDASPASSGVLGLDPLNEPYPGSGYPSPCADFAACPAFEQTQLYDFYDRVIAALRSVGDHHVIFPEGIAQNAQAVPSLPKFTDQQTGFNWHYYCLASQLLPDATGQVTAQPCASADATAFTNITDYTTSLGVPWLVSEFGGNEASPEYAKEVDWMDSHFLSRMEWMYYQAATDPANAPGQGLLTVDALGGSEANANQQKLDALVTPYAEAIAGTPQAFAFDRSTHSMTLTYVARAVPGAKLAPTAETSLFIPARQYPNGYRITVSNGHETAVYGQWLQIAADSPGATVTVTVSPAN